MYPFKLKPATKDYIWGGDRLKHEYGVCVQYRRRHSGH